VNGKLGSGTASRVIRFGPYEIDRQTNEVRKHGIRLKLAGQPLQVLLFLLERAGELVTRDELQQRLWPQDVFVDFERSLNSAVKKLRAALSDNPDKPRYIETHPRQGYRFIGQMIETPLELSPSAAPQGSEDPVGQQAEGPPEIATVLPPSSMNFVRWVAASVVLVLVAGGLFFSLRHRFPSAATKVSVPKGPNVRSSVAILGFKNLSFQHQADWLGKAIMQMLTTELQAGGKLRIVPEEAVARSKAKLDLKEKDGYPRDTLRELNKDLSCDYAVAGSYVALGDQQSGQVRLDLRLQETISGETLASIAVSGKQAEIFDLVRTAGREMQTKVGGTIGPGGDTDWRAVLPANAEAARLYSAGLDRLRLTDRVSASKLLQQSVDLEPQFALSHAALAEAWQDLGYESRAQASAQKAMSLAANLPENARLKVEGQYYESQHDWAGAIPAYRHLFQDYPDDLEAGLKLADTEVSAGQLNDASATISSLRSPEATYHQDSRIDLIAALVAARSSDFKLQQELARSVAKKAESSASSLLLGRAKMIEGWALDDQSQLDQALQAYRTAQSIFEQAGDIDSTATVLDDIGIVLEKQGDRKAARENLEEAQKQFRQIGDQNGLGSALTNLGELDHAEGELAGAEDLYREALGLFRKNSRKENEYAALNNLGGVLFERGDFREAKQTYDSVLQLRQAVGDKSGVGYAKINLAAAFWVQGDLDHATRLLEDAQRTFTEIGDRAGISSVQTAYARVMISKNDLPEARHRLGEAMKIDREISHGDIASEEILLAQITLLEGHAGQVDEAALKSIIEEFQAQQRGGDEMEGLAIEIQMLLARGQVDLARQALERTQSLHNTTWLSNYHLMLTSAQVDAAAGRSDLSKRKIAAASARAQKVGCGACELESRSTLSKIDGKKQHAWSRVIHKTTADR